MRIDEASTIRYMNFMDAAYDDEYFWAINEVFGGLYKISRSDYRVEYIAPLFLGKENLKLKVHKAVKFGDNIIFFPWNTQQRIFVYNKMSNCVNTISFPKGAESNIRFCTIIDIRGKFYFFPQHHPSPLLILDPNSWEFQVVHKWKDLLTTHTRFLRGKNFRLKVVALGNNVYMSIVDTTINLEVNLDTLAVKRHSFDGFKLGATSYDGSILWIAGSDEYKVISWDPEKDRIKYFYNNSTVYDQTIKEYAQIACIDSRVILLPRSGKTISFVDKDRQEIRYLDSLPEELQIIKNRVLGFSYWGKTIIGNHLIVFPASGNMLLELDKVTLKAQGRKVIIDQRISQELILKYYYGKLEEYVNQETLNDSIYSLDILCFIMTAEEEKVKEVEDKKIGASVFSHIKRELYR